jgi:hypothetical protein
MDFLNIWGCLGTTRNCSGAREVISSVGIQKMLFHQHPPIRLKRQASGLDSLVFAAILRFGVLPGDNFGSKYSLVRPGKTN